MVVEESRSKLKRPREFEGRTRWASEEGERRGRGGGIFGGNLATAGTVVVVEEVGPLNVEVGAEAVIEGCAPSCFSSANMASRDVRCEERFWACFFIRWLRYKKNMRGIIRSRATIGTTMAITVAPCILCDDGGAALDEAGPLEAVVGDGVAVAVVVMMNGVDWATIICAPADVENGPAAVGKSC